MGWQKKAGSQAEKLAAAFLTEKGVRILEKNFRCRQGEIDLIGTDGSYIIAVEVKMRTGHKNGWPEEAVDVHKQRKICRTFNVYRMREQITDFAPVRFDVVTVDKEGSCQWIKNAFEFLEF